jgi:toxin ParE1/3/4
VIRRAVVYSAEAESDLAALYDYLAAAASPAVAIRVMRRLRTWLDGFDIGAERGTRRDDIRPGLRTIGFERRVTAAFTIDDERMLILRLFYGGQAWQEALSEG